MGIECRGAATLWAFKQQTRTALEARRVASGWGQGHAPSEAPGEESVSCPSFWGAGNPRRS